MPITPSPTDDAARSAEPWPRSRRVWQVVLIAMIAITFALGAPPTSSSRSQSCSALSAVTTMLIAVPIQERMGGSHNGRPALHQVFIPGAH